MEGNFINFLENLKSFKSLNLACLFYFGISSDLIKRRDVYKHYKKKDIDTPHIETNQKGINSTNESKKDNNNFANKKMIVDDFDEFYYDEEQFEIHNKINRDRNNRRSTRQRENNINYQEINLNLGNNKNNEPNVFLNFK